MALQADLSSVRSNDIFNDVQTQSKPLRRSIGAVDAVEFFKNPALFFGGDAYALVFNCDPGETVPFLTGDLNLHGTTTDLAIDDGLLAGHPSIYEEFKLLSAIEANDVSGFSSVSLSARGASLDRRSSIT